MAFVATCHLIAFNLTVWVRQRMSSATEEGGGQARRFITFSVHCLGQTFGGLRLRLWFNYVEINFDYQVTGSQIHVQLVTKNILRSREGIEQSRPRIMLDSFILSRCRPENA